MAPEQAKRFEASARPAGGSPPALLEHLPCDPQLAGTTPAIPDYELLRPIGHGAYGQVWLARNLTGSFFAVKVVARTSFDHDRPFEREFEGIKSFEPISRSDPSQVAVLHVGRGKGFFYYVMELADSFENPKPTARSSDELRIPDTESPAGEEVGRASELRRPPDLVAHGVESYTPHTLREDLKARGHLPANECVEIGLALTRALIYLHRCGLVHRDVKPSNVIFVGGMPKLADIGLVTSVDATRSLVGTEGYVAPEGPGTPQADLYSLGKLLYEMGTGCDRKEFPALPLDIATRPDRDALMELNAVVMRACQFDPRQRHGDAKAMFSELSLLRQGDSVKRRHARQRNLGKAKRFALGTSVMAVVTAVAYWLEPSKSGPPPITRSKNEAADEAFRSGKLSLQTGSSECFTQAAKYFEHAIELDHNFAAAYARLGHVFIWMGAPVGDSNLLVKARAAAETAVAIDPKSADGHGVLGSTIQLLEHDWKKAEKELLLALRLDPNSEDILFQYANCLVVAGRAGEAAALVQKALRLESRSVLRLQNAGWVYCAAHRYREAIREYDELLEKVPSSLLHVSDWLALACRESGNYSKAIEVERKAALLAGKSPEQVKLKYDAFERALQVGGINGFWNRRLEWAKTENSQPGELAALYARVGDNENAFKYLNQALERTPEELIFQINTDPSFDTLRTNARFAEVLKKLGPKR